jgi:hypothetical protein
MMGDTDWNGFTLLLGLTFSRFARPAGLLSVRTLRPLSRRNLTRNTIRRGKFSLRGVSCGVYYVLLSSDWLVFAPSRRHVIVGRNFGSYVTHETKHFIYFYLGQVAILLFKSG